MELGEKLLNWFTDISIGGVVLQTSSGSSSSEIAIASGAISLILAWVACITLTAVGILKKNNKILSSGILADGIMTVLTPLVYYVLETLRLGTFTASIQDFLLLATLSTLGGAIITIGLLRFIHKGLRHNS